MKHGDAVPALVAVVARNVIDGMTVWGRVENDEVRLWSTPFAVESIAVPSSAVGHVRVEVTSEADGDTFLMFGDGDLVMVESGR